MLKKFNFRLEIPPLILSLILALIILTGLESLPARLPLFYSLIWGEGQLATHRQFLIIPSGIILISLLNFTIASQLHPSQAFFKIILRISSLVIAAILAVTFIKIVLMFL